MNVVEDAWMLRLTLNGFVSDAIKETWRLRLALDSLFSDAIKETWRLRLALDSFVSDAIEETLIPNLIGKSAIDVAFDGDRYRLACRS